MHTRKGESDYVDDTSIGYLRKGKKAKERA